MFRPILLLTPCVGALLLSACSKPAPPPTTSASDSRDPVTMPSAAPVATEPPAESSLALKRGMLSMTEAFTTFKPCGEETPLWVLDQTDALRATFEGEAKPLELYVEAHGERGPVPPELVAARAYHGVFIVEEVLYATQPGESQGCAQPAPDFVVAARGNEPFWSVEVKDDTLIWRQPEEPKELVFEALQSEDAEGAVGYSGSSQGHKLELFVEQQACRDSMSGAYFAYSARATFNGKPLKGCARIGG